VWGAIVPEKKVEGESAEALLALTERGTGNTSPLTREAAWFKNGGVEWKKHSTGYLHTWQSQGRGKHSVQEDKGGNVRGERGRKAAQNNRLGRGRWSKLSVKIQEPMLRGVEETGPLNRKNSCKSNE